MKNINSFEEFVKESLMDKMTPKDDNELKRGYDNLDHDIDRFFYAVSAGMLDELKQLPRKEDRMVSSSVLPAINVAIDNGQFNTFKYLIDEYKFDKFIYKSIFYYIVDNNNLDNNNLEMVKYIIDNFDIDVTTDKDWAMRAAIVHGNVDMLKLLIKSGAKVKNSTVKFADSDKTSIQMAKDKDFVEILDIIEKERNNI